MAARHAWPATPSAHPAAQHRRWPLPADVRLMNAVASTVFVLAALGAAGRGVQWLARRRCSHPAIQLEGDLSAQQRATIRANAAPRWPATSSAWTCSRPRGLRGRALGAPCRGAPRLARPPGGAPGRAPRRWRCGRATTACDRLVNSFGEVFEANVGDVEDDNLPVLSGPEAARRDAGAVSSACTRCCAPLTWRSAAAAAVRPRLLARLLDSGATLELGRGSEAEVVARTERFVRTLAR
jgi:cell division protein FtsQ